MAKHLNKNDMKFIERGLDKATASEELSNCLYRDSRVFRGTLKSTEL